MISFGFDKIYIIESLRPGEKKTGTELFKEISILLKTENSKVEIELLEIETAKQFFACFEKISYHVQVNKIFPVIHIESHGGDDGLELGSRELIGTNIIDPLIKINIACKNNLLFTIAACKGAFITDRIFEKLDKPRAPFWLLIAPKENMYSYDLESAFTGFYTELLKTLNLDIALGKLDSRYEFPYCRNIFVEAFKGFYELNNAKSRRERAEHLLTRLLQSPQYRKSNIGELRRKIKNGLGTSESFEIFKESFFMFDLYPENRDRFNIDYAEITGFERRRNKYIINLS